MPFDKFGNLGPLGVGDEVTITDLTSPYHGQNGTITKQGVKGGLYVEHADGNVIYHPWGYTPTRKVQEETSKIVKASLK